MSYLATSDTGAIASSVKDVCRSSMPELTTKLRSVNSLSLNRFLALRKSLSPKPLNLSHLAVEDEGCSAPRFVA